MRYARLPWGKNAKKRGQEETKRGEEHTVPDAMPDGHKHGVCRIVCGAQCTAPGLLRASKGRERRVIEEVYIYNGVVRREGGGGGTSRYWGKRAWGF
jgi:hypothetical protein